MNTYEVSNPSDPITLQADDDMIAAAAGLLLGEGRYGVKRDEQVVLPIFLLGGFKEWAEEVKFNNVMIVARHVEIVACLRSAAIGNPPPEVRADSSKLESWNEKRQSSANNITARARQLAALLETKYGSEPPPLFAEVHPRTDARDQALADLGNPGLIRFALTNLYLSTGRSLPKEGKQTGVRFGFCDEVGNFKPKAEATHVGWNLVP